MWGMDGVMPLMTSDPAPYSRTVRNASTGLAVMIRGMRRRLPLAAFFLAAGALHFLRPRMYEAIMPDALPAHRELVYASGLAELAGGAGVLDARPPRGGGPGWPPPPLNLDALRGRGRGSDFAPSGGLGVLAARPRGDQGGREDRAEHRERRAHDERDLEALGEGVGERRRVAARGLHQLVGARIRDGDEDGQAERAADLLRRVDEPGREPRLLRRHAAHRADGHRHEREAEADRRQQRREQDVADVAAAHGHLGEPDERDGGEHEARDEHRLEADLGHQAGR